jgi:hypothetical protein
MSAENERERKTTCCSWSRYIISQFYASFMLFSLSLLSFLSPPFWYNFLPHNFSEAFGTTTKRKLFSRYKKMREIIVCVSVWSKQQKMCLILFALRLLFMQWHTKRWGEGEVNNKRRISFLAVKKGKFVFDFIYFGLSRSQHLKKF